MKIVFLGDSLTYGFSVKRSKIWTQIIEDESEHISVNKGISGDTSGGMLARFYRDVHDEKPDYVHIMGGGNDFISGGEVSQVKSNFMAMTQEAMTYGIKPIIGIAPEPVIERVISPWKEFIDFKHVLAKRAELSEWVFRYAECFKVPVIDYSTAFKERNLDMDSLYLDGLHFNEDGNKILAEIFLEEFPPKLKK